jgi:peptidoglycan/xylan/chitin deacetylase (PgdA/CDA1 family)
MKIFLWLIFSSSLWASPFQYPEDRPYTSADRGMRAYRALSIYKTGTFVLSFDDGPHATRTEPLLDVLKKHQVKAIFFVLSSYFYFSFVPMPDGCV